MAYMNCGNCYPFPCCDGTACTTLSITTAQVMAHAVARRALPARFSFYQGVFA